MNLSLLRFAFVALAALGLSARPAMAQATLLNTDLDALVRSGPALVGVSTTGAIVRSTNTTAPYTFTQVRATDSPRKVFALASSGNSVVAMGDAGHYAISTNAGLTFSTFNASVSPAFVGTINAVAFASSRWVAVGKRGNNIVGLTSTNGTTWAYATSMPSTPGELRALAWTGSRWVAVGGSTSAAGFALTSTDGATWTQLANSAYPFNLAPARLNAVATDGAGRVLAVGDAGTMLFSSNNGTTFTDAADNIVSEDLQSALFISGTQWVAGGNSAALVNYNASLGALGASLPFDPIPAESRLRRSSSAPAPANSFTPTNRTSSRARSAW